MVYRLGLSALLLAAASGCNGNDTSDDTSANVVDADGDGFPASSDCDDADSAINAGATELCDGIDNNCNGEIDEEEAEDATIWYVDGDADGFGAPNRAETPAITSCVQPTDYVDNSDDCNDNNDASNPGEDEICGDLLDNDCNGLVDEDEAVDAIPLYPDADNDDYGDGSVDPIFACDVPVGYSENPDDCDDTQALRNPGLPELCDGLDNDCDGVINDAGAISRNIQRFESFAAALAGASDGDELIVCQGTYNENIVIDNHITIRAIDGVENTIIEGTGDGSVITANGTPVSLIGLTIRGGVGADGGGVNGERSLDLSIEDCVITGNEARTEGGGVYGPTDGVLAITNTTISDNEARSGGGVFAPALAFFSGVTITNNEADDGGGVYADGGLDYQWDTSTAITNNVAEKGGGVYVDGANLTLEPGTTISNNRATEAGGGLYLNAGGFTEGQISANSAPDGGGVYVQNSSQTISDASIFNNTGTNGGGLYIVDPDGSNTTIFSDMLLSSNSVTGQGGGVFLNAAAAEFSNVNTVSNLAANGGGLYLSSATMSFNVGSLTSNTTLEEDANGGGVYLSTGSIFSFLSIDFGEDASDNAPEDIYIQGSDTRISDLGVSSTGDCDDSGCE
ncbi:MAG: MopE-related protein [Myxococcota bacterium]